MYPVMLFIQQANSNNRLLVNSTAELTINLLEENS
jgi:hypothetical protein